MLPLLLCLAGSLIAATDLAAQDVAVYSRLNTLDGFAEYANNSSHIVAGQARNRRLLTFGAGYSRRLLLRRSLELQYRAELRPVVFESDPVVNTTFTFTPNANAPPGFQAGSSSSVFRQVGPCLAGVTTLPSTNGQGVVIAVSTLTNRCGNRIWTYGQALSPAGLRLSLLPRSHIHPTFSILGGYLFSTQPIPLANAGSFNFTYEFGAGFEIFHTEPVSGGFFGNRSIRVEYRIHHISNKNTADQNPGIDTGLLQVSYAFGR